jgi:hypothetical protein
LTGWTGVQAINFDKQGRLVTYNFFANEVRVYDPSGTLVGGFNSTTSPMLTPGGDIMVMPDGNYIVGTSANGARVFTPQGAFVRQYGEGRLTSIALLPDHKLWAGNSNSLTMNVFDTDSGDQVGSFMLDQQTRPSYQQYSATTNTVLVIDTDRDAGGIFERDLTGTLLRQFHLPVAQVGISGATRGLGGDVYGTHSWYPPSYYDETRWSASGTLIDQKAIWDVAITPTRILWVGNIPEPATGLAVLAGVARSLTRVRRRTNRGGAAEADGMSRDPYR